MAMNKWTSTIIPPVHMFSEDVVTPLTFACHLTIILLIPCCEKEGKGIESVNTHCEVKDRVRERIQ